MQGFEDKVYLGSIKNSENQLALYIIDGIILFVKSKK
jgi:hypothetical protein